MASIHVGDVDRAVGADQSVVCFRDQNTVFLPHDAAGFGEGQFDDTRVELIAASPATGGSRRVDLCQFHESPFRLGHNFVFDDEDVAFLQSLLFAF